MIKFLYNFVCIREQQKLLEYTSSGMRHFTSCVTCVQHLEVEEGLHSKLQKLRVIVYIHFDQEN